MDNRSFLDIDDSILTRNLLLPENASKDEMPMREPDAKPFIIIQPEPGLCIKVKTHGTREKVFINICTSDKIPPPDDVSEVILLQGIISQKDPDFVVPMSIGNERLETDKNGSPALTYDVVINTKYFEKCMKNKHFLIYTVMIATDAVSSKFDKALNTMDSTILKNKKAMGKLQPHRIENREARKHSQRQEQLIEEIKYPLRKRTSEKENDSKNYVLLGQPVVGPITNLIGLFQISKGVTANEVDVLMDKDRIVIIIEKINQTYDLTLPYFISVADVKCFLDKDLRMLRLDMPVEYVSDKVETVGIHEFD